MPDLTIAGDGSRIAGAFNIGPVAVAGLTLEISDDDQTLYNVPAGWSCVWVETLFRCHWAATLEPGGLTPYVAFDPPPAVPYGLNWAWVVPAPGELVTDNNGGFA